jgi:hypothetical protein
MPKAAVTDFHEAIGQGMVELCGELNYVARAA